MVIGHPKSVSISPTPSWQMEPCFWHGSPSFITTSNWLAVLLSAILIWRCPDGHAAPRPNIVVIMADDMGWSDIGCYGGEIQTPILDELASRGIRFTQFYNVGRCCPSRASLLTGLYPHQTGVGYMMQDDGLPGYRGDLNRNCQTIAEVLSAANYRTYMSGKWHLTKEIFPRSVLDQHNWPRQRGFDRFFGTIYAAGSFYDPMTLARDNRLIPPDSPDFFYTDAIADNAIAFLEDHHRSYSGQPFFLYVPFTAPHWPMHARPKNIAKYSGVYDKGWDQLRRERYRRQVQLGLIDSNCRLSPRDSLSPAWRDAKRKQWEIRLMEVYAAMVDCMDQNVGRIVQALKDHGQFENTLIFFLADNGGCEEDVGRDRALTYVDSEPERIKPMPSGALQFEMVPRRTRDGKSLRLGRGVMAGPPETYLAYGRPWANLSNTPFRMYKHWVHEGGISSPLIVHWPNRMDASRQGRLERQPAHVIDIMATCLRAAGASYPEQVNGRLMTPLQGVSLTPALQGQPLGRTDPLYWEHEGNRAMREGKWKLVSRGARGRWELYDMNVDRSELNDLAAARPQRVREMSAAWEAWAIKAKVKPSIWNH